jgi:DNA-binding NarL/FixJ family response regulator
MSIRVLLADDHAVVRQALRLLLEGEGFEVVAEAGDGKEAWRLAGEATPDVAVLDLMMPVQDGIEAAREIRRVSPQTATVLLTSRSDERHALEALRAGVKGCALKTHEARDLIQAVREVARGGTYLSPGISGAVVQAYLGGTPTADPLTSRERQVLKLIAEGQRTREIAEILGISVKTAESHRSRIMKKLNIRETAGLVRYALRRGLSEL